MIGKENLSKSGETDPIEISYHVEKVIAYIEDNDDEYIMINYSTQKYVDKPNKVRTKNPNPKKRKDS